MKKILFHAFFGLTVLLFSLSNNAYAEMQTESLKIGIPDTENDETTYSQVFQNKEVVVPQSQQEQPVKEKEVIMVPVNNYYYSPYYYPHMNNYTRRIGPYGVYSNWGIGGYDYRGFAFNYGSGNNKAIYVNNPAPPPPPPPHYQRPGGTPNPPPPPKHNFPNKPTNQR